MLGLLSCSCLDFEFRQGSDGLGKDTNSNSAPPCIFSLANTMLPVFSRLLYLEFISLHRGLSGRGDYVSHHTVRADDFNVCAGIVLIEDLFLSVCKVLCMPQQHCEDEKHFNAF